MTFNNNAKVGDVWQRYNGKHKILEACEADSDGDVEYKLKRLSTGDECWSFIPSSDTVVKAAAPTSFNNNVKVGDTWEGPRDSWKVLGVHRVDSQGDKEYKLQAASDRFECNAYIPLSATIVKNTVQVKITLDTRRPRVSGGFYYDLEPGDVVTSAAGHDFKVIQLKGKDQHGRHLYDVQRLTNGSISSDCHITDNFSLKFIAGESTEGAPPPSTTDSRWNTTCVHCGQPAYDDKCFTWECSRGCGRY